MVYVRRRPENPSNPLNQSPVPPPSGLLDHSAPRRSGCRSACHTKLPPFRGLYVCVCTPRTNWCEWMTGDKKGGWREKRHHAGGLGMGYAA